MTTWQEMFRLVEKQARDYDWVLKADDDTFMVMENLRNLLSNFQPDKPLFAGAIYHCPYCTHRTSRRTLNIQVSQTLFSFLICQSFTHKKIAGRTAATALTST